MRTLEAVRFGVLGPLAVWTDGGAAVHVPEPKVRTLLAMLLAEPGRPVSADRLVDALWRDRPPRNPSGTLQARVSQLRRVLDDAEPGARALLVSRPPGYLIDVPPDAVDSGRFTALAVQAAEMTDPLARARLLGEALELWRGPAFDGFDLADNIAAAGLEERRLAALEEHAEARLELGEHAALSAELAGEVARHPLRERLRAAHLRALYRAGRRARPSPDTTTCGNGSPMSWASTRAPSWPRSTCRCWSRRRRRRDGSGSRPGSRRFSAS